MAPGWNESVAKGAPRLPQLSTEGMGGVTQDGLEFVPHPPLHHYLQTAQYEPTNDNGTLCVSGNVCPEQERTQSLSFLMGCTVKIWETYCFEG